METDSPKSILLVKLSAIGDVVHTLPLLETLRKNFPGARIHWLIEEEAGDLIQGHWAVDRVIVSRRKKWRKRIAGAGGVPAVLKEVTRFLKELRKEEYDIVIDLQGLLKSGILTGLSRGKRKIGFTGGREGSFLFLKERPFPVDYDQHAIDRYLKAAEVLDCTPGPWQGSIPLSSADKDPVDRFLKENGLWNTSLVTINPIARWETKLWQPDRFAALADKMQKTFLCKVLFTGSRQDRPVIDRIIRSMDTKPFNLAGRTSLKELAYLFSLCRFSITTDTGPMHMAAAMGRPVIALFGPTEPRRTGPYGNGHRVIRAEIACSPCFKKKCDHRTCMKRITVDEVYAHVEEVFAESLSPGGSA